VLKCCPALSLVPFSSHRHSLTARCRVRKMNRKVGPLVVIDQTISHYRHCRKIAGGGMGVSIKLRTPSLARSSPSNSCPTKWSRNPQVLERFLPEARAASALNHPNICTIYEIGKHGEQSFNRHGVFGWRDPEATHCGKNR